jgi:serralysin
MPGFSDNFGVQYTVNSPDQNINGVAGGWRWSLATITFNFPAGIAIYPAGYGPELGYANFASLTAGQAAATTNILLTQFGAVIPNIFTQAANTAIADISSARADLLNQDGTPFTTGWAYFPSTASNSGDVWYRNTGGAVGEPTKGEYSWFTIAHELGHAMGLKHGHETDGGVTMTADRNSTEFSIMTYAGYIGAPTAGGYENETFGYAQSLMMYDIAALQFAYGADFNTRSGNTIYTFDANTGQMSINGAGQGAPGANRIFLTIWDGGGTDTYDLSNYTTGTTIDLRPGQWSVLSQVQLANLGNNNFARGNVFNALQHQGDVRSLIENATGGSGADSITGNAAANVLIGGADADTMDGGDGADTYYADNAGDMIGETNDVVATGGYDIVFATANITLGANIEQLVIQGAATGGTGGATANYLYGGNSGLSLSLNGGGGDDVIYSGLAGGNTVAGGSGVDTLLLYGGNNRANGGLGSDIYYTYTATDVLSETGGDGIDTVYATYTITLALGFEQLLLSGAATGAIGSADNNIIYGNSTSGAVSILGLAGADVLFGGANNDTLEGGDGVDLLFGLGGANTLVGGNDTDVYYLQTTGNIVTEDAGGGFDTIYSNAAGTTTLAANVEQLILYGAATGGTGTSGNDYLYGNASGNALILDGGGGNDYLLGSAQNDTLIGGAGNDVLDLRGGGVDRLRYTAPAGADYALGFSATGGGADVIDIVGLGYTAIGVNLTVTASGGDTLVTFTGGTLSGTVIRLAGVTAGDMTAANFAF